MPNTIPATGEAVTKQAHSLNLLDVAAKSGDNVMSTTRRSFLSALPGLAAASAIPVVIAIDGRTAHAAPGPSAIVAGPRENPELLRAYDELIAARAELAEAQDALEWLADEWRHLWPLAPEELLEGANAHQGYPRNDNAERDIIGRFMMRDTADLTNRLNRQFREMNEKQCFNVCTVAEAEKYIANLSRQTPKGRTEKALARDRAWIKDRLAIWNKRLVLAREYEAETARLRHESGVQRVKQQISVAELAVVKSRVEISKIPAFTHEGLRIKAEALKMYSLFDGQIDLGGPLDEAARFIKSVLDVAGNQKSESAQ
ncbi:hypothetical protein [Rhizobium sp. SG741]|uniref:hypothetical protein n=1 Tax=Rhizobium sp. SG741 TaxID=2587114 RepID=UPI001446BAED|nr:hypothetical protein [Rhizobium sp. SG741]NKJ03448.1 hypothetical protein [Rhizobium sp. SG741]